MTKLMAIIARFPEHELAIRRLCVQDAAFEGTCEDYADAAIALRHWEHAGDGFAHRAAEYRVILEELYADIVRDLTPHLRRVSQIKD